MAGQQSTEVREDQRSSEQKGTALPVPEEAVEALAEMRWDEARVDSQQATWDQLTEPALKAKQREDARFTLEEVAPFLALAPALRKQGADQERQRIEEERKSARRIAEQLEIVATNLANIPASREIVARLDPEIESISRLMQQLRAGEPHHDAEWEQLERERDEAAQSERQRLKEALGQLASEFESQANARDNLGHLAPYATVSGVLCRCARDLRQRLDALEADRG